MVKPRTMKSLQSLQEKRSLPLVTMSFTPLPCPFYVLAIALFIYYISVPAETEVK